MVEKENLMTNAAHCKYYQTQPVVNFRGLSPDFNFDLSLRPK